MHLSTKTFTHELGLSACFRQWRAQSHCRFLHGYALSFKVVFQSTELDSNNWVVDFGSLKSYKAALEDAFDHKLVVAEDDPELASLSALEALGLVQLRVLPHVGCEAFARYACDLLTQWLETMHLTPRVSIHSVECREHGANSAIYVPNM